MRNRWLVVLLLTILMVSCAPRAVVVKPSRNSIPTVVAPGSLPNFLVRLSVGQGPTRTALNVTKGARITFVALNGNFTIENEELQLQTKILAGQQTVVAIAPSAPSTFVLRCTQGCPLGKDTITVTTLM